ncbi:MAG: hypothetical protein IT372_18570, partial [Polyangiaceae bacterium]|nr:hypothetical protein [Polyangiaceae bacterium]
MLPLDPLEGVSDVPEKLRRAPAPEVRAEIERARAAAATGEAGLAALAFARGVLAAREAGLAGAAWAGRAGPPGAERGLDEARRDLERAAAAFDALGEREAAGIARCEALLVRLRRGPRAAYGEIAAELEAIAAEADGDAAMERVWLAATRGRASAQRRLGHAAAARRALHEALPRSERAPEERARILGALGALYAEAGAFGAAEALLEHAAELHHRRGDAVGEARASGELALAALGLGDLEGARRHLVRQERLSADVGDAPGRAGALALLADVMLELDRPDDAAAMVASARAVAEGSSPPSHAWAAEARRVLARARRGVDPAAAAADLDAAGALFAELGSPLGAALATWDRAYAAAADATSGPAGGPEEAWFTPAWALASLGLAPRVAQLLRDRRQVQRAARSAGDEARERALAAVAQSTPRLAAQQEVELLFDRPDELAAVAARRASAQRNLGRLAALTLARPGLVVAAIASSRAGASGLALPPRRAAAACAAALPDVTIWL